ncbi:MAG: glycosyltransferase family 39 protein [Verrucomicrobia bacterium]|nr:glycosyltransferase family 39 protein [Verrucomicrobiota bacterium]
MSVVLAAVSFLVLLVAPGFALTGFLAPRTSERRLSVGEAIALVPCLSFLVSSFVALVLAEVGAFSLPLLLVLVGVISSGLWLAGRQAIPSIERGRGWRIELAFLAVVVVVCGVLYFRPHEYIFGGWDPSTYVATGASIEQTGGILYRDEAFAALPPEAQRALMHRRQGLDQRFPGLLVADRGRGLISPQFHHLYPAWLAVFRSWGGDRAMLYVNPLFGVLSVLMLFALCRRFLPPGRAFAAAAALAAAVLLALNLTQVWQARFSTAEMTAQLSILTLLYLLLLYVETESVVAGVFAAVALDLAIQARYDSLLLVPLLVLVVYARNLVRWRRRDWVLVAGGAAALAHVVLHSVFVSFLYRPGVQYLTGHGGLWAAAAAGVLVVLGAVLVAFRRWPGALSRLSTSQGVRIAAIALLIVAAFFASIVRPELAGGDEQDRRSFVALGWFMTPLGLALAVAGACLLVWNARSTGELALLVVGLVLVVYVRSAHVESFYMWRARRFVPIVVPMLCLFAAYGLAVMTEPLGRWRAAACGAVALVLGVVPLAKNRTIVTVRDNEGALALVAQVAAQLDGGEAVICNHYWLAMPLRMLHSVETYAVSDPEPRRCRAAVAQARTMIETGRRVFFLGQERPHVFRDLAAVPVENGRFTFRSRRLARGSELPRTVEELDITAVIYELIPIERAPDDTRDVDLTWEFEPDWFNAGSGFRRGPGRQRTFQVAETPDGERLDPTPDTDPAAVTEEYAWLTAKSSALWIPYDPARRYVAEIRLSGQGAGYGVGVEIAGQRLADIEPQDAFHTVVVEIPAGIETGTPRRALLQFTSLAPEGYKGQHGVWLDRIRLRSTGL